MQCLIISAWRGSAREWEAARLERVVLNLLSNAIEYSPDGGEITVRVATEHEGTGRWAVLTVSD